MAPRYAAVDLPGLIRFVASCFESLARDKDMRFAVEAPSSLPAQVDGEKVQRILLNLLANAFKFTPCGGRVTLSLARDGDKVRFTVADSGQGVPEAMRQAVFERFRQVDEEASRSHGGTGLGRPLPRNLP